MLDAIRNRGVDGQRHYIGGGAYAIEFLQVTPGHSRCMSPQAKVYSYLMLETISKKQDTNEVYHGAP